MLDDGKVCGVHPLRPERTDVFCAYHFYAPQASTQHVARQAPGSALTWVRGDYANSKYEGKPYTASLEGLAEYDGNWGLHKLEVVKEEYADYKSFPWHVRVYYAYTADGTEHTLHRDYRKVSGMGFRTLADAKDAAAAFAVSKLGSNEKRAEFLFSESTTMQDPWPKPWSTASGLSRQTTRDWSRAMRTTALTLYGADLDDVTYALAAAAAEQEYDGTYASLVLDARDLVVALKPAERKMVASLGPAWTGTAEGLVAVACAIASQPPGAGRVPSHGGGTGSLRRPQAVTSLAPGCPASGGTHGQCSEEGVQV